MLRVYRGRHPSEKTTYKRMIQLKDILVKNNQGELLHTTYARRAKGLVKKGRAYYVDSSTICLVCNDLPLKENVMENVHIQDILDRMDAIIKNSEYLKEAFMTFEKMDANLEIEATKIRANTIMEIVKDREKTNQQMIQLLQSMYEKCACDEETVE